MYSLCIRVLSGLDASELEIAQEYFESIFAVQDFVISRMVGVSKTIREQALAAKKALMAAMFQQAKADAAKVDAAAKAAADAKAADAKAVADANAAADAKAAAAAKAADAKAVADAKAADAKAVADANAGAEASSGSQAGLRKKPFSYIWLWVILAVVAAIAIGAGIFFYVRR